LGTGALLAVAAAAGAQTPQSSNRFLHPEEIAPYFTSAGDANGVGLTVRWPIRSRLAVQAEGEFRNEERDVEFYRPGSAGFNGNVVLVLDLPGAGRITPFLVGGGGLEHHRAPDDWAPSLELVQWRGADSFVVNAGGGVRVGLTDRVGVRVELRYADGWAGGAVDSFRVMTGTTITFGKR
jgi:opacity protein-like surface antigen